MLISVFSGAFLYKNIWGLHWQNKQYFQKLNKENQNTIKKQPLGTQGEDNRSKIKIFPESKL